MCKIACSHAHIYFKVETSKWKTQCPKSVYKYATPNYVLSPIFFTLLNNLDIMWRKNIGMCNISLLDYK